VTELPYDIRAGSPRCPQGKPFAVVKQGSDVPLGCHPTRESAMKQQAALYASERKAER
jgi:hypothetical protein